MMRAVRTDRGKPAYANVPAELDTTERAALDQAMADLKWAVQIALEVTLGSLPADAGSAPFGGGTSMLGGPTSETERARHAGG